MQTRPATKTGSGILPASIILISMGAAVAGFPYLFFFPLLWVAADIKWPQLNSLKRGKVLFWRATSIVVFIALTVNLLVLTPTPL